jgi:hypothetical protein
VLALAFGSFPLNPTESLSNTAEGGGGRILCSEQTSRSCSACICYPLFTPTAEKSSARGRFETWGVAAIHGVQQYSY